MCGLRLGLLPGARIAVDRHDDNLWWGSLGGFRIDAEHEQLIVGLYTLAIGKYLHDDRR